MSNRQSSFKTNSDMHCGPTFAYSGNLPSRIESGPSVNTPQELFLIMQLTSIATAVSDVLLNSVIQNQTERVMPHQ
jgi:hypothetical protein